MNMLDELVNALLWNMVHDSSYVNRSAVLQSLPMENLIMDAASSQNVKRRFVRKMNLIEAIVERV